MSPSESGVCPRTATSDLPLPGSGRTWERVTRLAAITRDDTVVGRIADAHTEAVAILTESSGPTAKPSRCGVWAAEPPQPILRASRILARSVRAVVEHSASEVLDRVGRALGAAPLCADAEHARRVADLTLYLRQSHAERDLTDVVDDALTAARASPKRA